MSVPVSVKARRAAASVCGLYPRIGTRPIAPPPPGSGLEPVMGAPGPPLVGNTFSVFQYPLEFCKDSYERHGEISWTSAVGTKAVAVLGPEGINEVLANRGRAFSSEKGWSYFIGPFFNRGVMLMDFEEHIHHRRIMQQAFMRKRLIGYLDSMHPVIERHVAGWPTDAAFEILNSAKDLALDVATEVFMGTKADAQTHELHEAFIATVVGGQAVVRADVPGGRWHRGLVGRRLLETYFRDRVAAKRDAGGDDLFAALCRAETEEGDRFSDDDVVNHMIFAMMAAHDTSTITFSMMAYYLAKHPEWQDRVREESLALGKAAIDYDDLEALPAMDMVFRETLRMNPPVGTLAREAIKDTEIRGHFVPEGSKVMVALYATHRMEPWWDDPDTFDPERFDPDNPDAERVKNAWMPFGGYAHKCIGMFFGGMEVKAIMHRLLIERRLSVLDGYEPVLDYGTGPFPADGLPISARPL